MSHKSDLRYSSPKLDVYLCDGGSFPPPESGLEAVLDLTPTTPSFVAPSSPSSLGDNIMLTMSFSEAPSL